jgi:peptide/nickel transport system substrate-binding protein
VACLLVLGCEPPSDIEKNKFGGVLIHSAPVSPTIIHPFLTTDSISVHLVPLIFNGLIKLEENNNLIPDLAESYEINQNGLEYKITLKKGARFHDGRELTSEDVKFTYEEIKEINEKKSVRIFDYDFSSLKNIKIVDKYNILITLKQPFAPFLYSLTVGILPKHLYQAKNNINNRIYWYPVGTGPFKLTFIDDKKVILNRFNNYFRGKSYLDKIIYEVHPSSLIWAKLLKGEIDYSKFISLDLFNETRKVDFLRTINKPESSVYLLFLNCRHYLFKNKKVRQALNYAIDKKKMITKILKNRGEICLGPVLPDSWAYNNDIIPYEYNPQKALEKLKEAGWEINNEGLLYKNGMPFEFKCVMLRGYPEIKKTVVFIQQQLNDIGIRMEIKTIHEVSEIFKYKESGDYESCFGLIDMSHNPEKNYSYFHSSRFATTNYFNYENAEVDELLDLGRKVLDREKQKTIYYKFQEILHDDPPGIFTFYKYTTIIIHKKFKNAFPDALTLFKGIENWWIDKNWQQQ